MTAKEKIIEILSKIGYDAKEVEKLRNGEIIKGLLIKEHNDKENDFLPVFYLDYDELIKKDKSEIIKYLKDLIEESENKSEDLKDFVNNIKNGKWEEVKDYVTICFNKEHGNNNNDIYRLFLDIYEVLYLECNEGRILVDKSILKNFSITEEEFWKQAEENLKKKNYVLKNMLPKFESEDNFCLHFDNLTYTEKTSKKEIKEFLSTIDKEQFMLVITSADNNYGASMIKNENILKTISDHLCEKFFIIPSSIHEVIITSYDENKIKELKELIIDVNKNCVIPEEKLSDSLYIYDGNIINIVS